MPNLGRATQLGPLPPLGLQLLIGYTTEPVVNVNSYLLNSELSTRKSSDLNESLIIPSEFE